MTLYELVNSVEVQGAVRVSAWDNDSNEHILFQTDATDYLGPGDLGDELEDREVGYLFCQDGILHIEVSNE